jgi:hypothetical protein
VPSVKHDTSTEEAEATAAHRKQWALWHLEQAATEIARQRGVLDYFQQRARDYGCTPAEIRAVLAAHQ